jgi:hypothetical protein
MYLKSLQISELKQIKLNSLEILSTSDAVIFWVIRPIGGQFPEVSYPKIGYLVISAVSSSYTVNILIHKLILNYVELLPDFLTLFAFYVFHMLLKRCLFLESILCLYVPFILLGTLKVLVCTHLWLIQHLGRNINYL